MESNTVQSLQRPSNDFKDPGRSLLWSNGHHTCKAMLLSSRFDASCGLALPIGSDFCGCEASEPRGGYCDTAWSSRHHKGKRKPTNLTQVFSIIE